MVLRIEADTCLPARRVIRVLEQLEESRGLPSMLRVDNGPEFISRRLDEWCRERKITLAFIQPGQPTQNAYVERLNGSIRHELLNAYIFRTLNAMVRSGALTTYYLNVTESDVTSSVTFGTAVSPRVWSRRSAALHRRDQGRSFR